MKRQALAVAIYALAMALLEAVVVVYLRRLLGVQGPGYSPGVSLGALHGLEAAREAATLVMLGAVGYLAGRNTTQRLGAFALAFGVWDIGYYLGLAALIGWPRSPLDWDLLFLLPSPWWGPVLAPVLVSLVLVWGGLRWMYGGQANWASAAIWAVGAGLLLLGFLLAHPYNFPWLVFGLGLVLFAYGWLGVGRFKPGGYRSPSKP
ncbi:MAG: hypothetical protein IVW51_15510 [Thermaceae bacterium]|nr:hypothetical protein [Thermaceae bacterium]